MGTRAEVLDPNCVLLRGLLSPKEQVRLFSFIEEKDCTPWNDLRPVMNPSPKTLLFGDNQPTLSFDIGTNSIITDMVQRATEVVLALDMSNSPIREQLMTRSENIKSLSMAAIQYKAPDGRFPPHIDHCSTSLVFLMSIGCTANFMVKGPAEGNEKQRFEFQSGDLLVFDASSEAGILHGVMGIKEGTCPAVLQDKFPILKGHRYGVQCRLRF